jgi:pimeloyl-ACP methyl ester carboxylesterase
VAVGSVTDRGRIVAMLATSRDGTRIAYERSGVGPAVLLVHGSLSDREHAWADVIPLLGHQVSAYALDRRGHGDSDDGQSYSLAREHQDIAAVIAAIHGPVVVVGHSFGSLCALGAIRATPGVSGAIFYEGIPQDGSSVIPEGLADRIEALVEAGDPEAALGLALAEVEHHRHHRRVHGNPAAVAGVATLARELEAERRFRFDAAAFRDRKIPTLVLTGSESAASIQADASALADSLPVAELVLLPGQRHGCQHADPELFAATTLGFVDRLGRQR